ncbi:hypothetical protein [Methylococcus mesophilus]|uniref:hypothetical protein n=1 Tax=Methylococcus mesophilus TaxID=2993564 RepID=UPI00224B3E94|nr:hypothetical protein [Methylococcus mesophilus]UZR28262.1 hypothetical protein OOT43_16310 [Methylococcus mesophilus]
MKYLLALTLACLPLPGLSDTMPVVERFIRDQARKTAGVEYKEARQLGRGDLNGDGKEDVAVLYTLEGFHGTNAYRQYLAVFSLVRSGLRQRTHREVGGKGWRDVDMLAVANGSIQLRTKEYADSDPSCCPSINGAVRLVLKGNRLKETK